MLDDALFERFRLLAADRPCALRLPLRKNNIEKSGIFVDSHTMRTKRKHFETQINFDAVIIAPAECPAAGARAHLGPLLESDCGGTGRRRPHPPDLVGSAAGKRFTARPGKMINCSNSRDLSSQLPPDASARCARATPACQGELSPLVQSKSA
jgi:hypothetical protein